MLNHRFGRFRLLTPLFGVFVLWIGLTTHAIWYNNQNEVRPVDDVAMHALSTFGYYELLRDPPPRPLATFLMIDTFYPPVAHVTAAVINLLTGHGGRRSALAVSLVFLPLFLFSVYSAARQFVVPRKALLVTLFAATTEGTFVSLHGFMLSMPTMAMIALAANLFVRSQGLVSRGYAVAAGIACGFGALTKFVFPFFAVGLFLAAFLRKFPYHPHLRRQIAINSFWCILLALGIALLWYWPNRVPFLQEAVDAGFRDNLRSVGFHHPGQPWLQSLLDPHSYLIPVLNVADVVFNPLSAPIWLWLVLMGLVRVDGRQRIRTALWLAMPLIFLVVVPRKQLKESLLFVPLIALTLAMALSQLRSRGTRFVAMGLIALIAAAGIVREAIWPAVAGPQPLKMAAQGRSINSGYYSYPTVVENCLKQVRETLTPDIARIRLRQKLRRLDLSADRFFYIAGPYGLVYWGPKLGLAMGPHDHLIRAHRGVSLGVFYDRAVADSVERQFRYSEFMVNWSTLRYWAAIRRLPILVTDLKYDQRGCEWPLNVPPDYLLSTQRVREVTRRLCLPQSHLVHLWTHTFSDHSRVYMYRVDDGSGR